MAKPNKSKTGTLILFTSPGAGWRDMALGEILTEDQIARVIDILRVNADDTIQSTTRLKEYLRTLDAQLAAKQILPDYLAYLLEWKRRDLLR